MTSVWMSMLVLVTIALAPWATLNSAVPMRLVRSPWKPPKDSANTPAIGSYGASTMTFWMRCVTFMATTA